VSIIKIVGFGNNKTRKICSDCRVAKKELGEIVAEKLFSAINFIESATSLNDIACFPSFHLHQLIGDRKEMFAMDLGRKIGYRLIIKPDPPLNKVEDKLDYNSKCSIVKCIIVLEVSKHYE
jgi:toxin HigB-1